MLLNSSAFSCHSEMVGAVGAGEVGSAPQAARCLWPAACGRLPATLTASALPPCLPCPAQVGASTTMLAAGYNIDCLMLRYQVGSGRQHGGQLGSAHVHPPLRGLAAFMPLCSIHSCCHSAHPAAHSRCTPAVPRRASTGGTPQSGSAPAMAAATPSA